MFPHGDWYSSCSHTETGTNRENLGGSRPDIFENRDSKAPRRNESGANVHAGNEGGTEGGTRRCPFEDPLPYRHVMLWWKRANTVVTVCVFSSMGFVFFVVASDTACARCQVSSTTISRTE